MTVFDMRQFLWTLPQDAKIKIVVKINDKEYVERDLLSLIYGLGQIELVLEEKK